MRDAITIVKSESKSIQKQQNFHDPSQFTNRNKTVDDKINSTWVGHGLLTMATFLILFAQPAMQRDLLWLEWSQSWTEMAHPTFLQRRRQMRIVAITADHQKRNLYNLFFPSRSIVRALLGFWKDEIRLRPSSIRWRGYLNLHWHGAAMKGGRTMRWLWHQGCLQAQLNPRTTSVASYVPSVVA